MLSGLSSQLKCDPKSQVQTKRFNPLKYFFRWKENISEDVATRDVGQGWVLSAR